MQKKKTRKIDIHNRETYEESETKCCECWEDYVKTKEDAWIECVSCRNWLHKVCSPYNDKCFDCGRKLLREKNSKMQKRI
jgi:DNA-directed RNA polymerase subunit RPC12/RpoP